LVQVILKEEMVHPARSLFYSTELEMGITNRILKENPLSLDTAIFLDSRVSGTATKYIQKI